MCQAVRQRIDIAVSAIRVGDLFGEPILIDHTAIAHQVAVDAAHNLRVVLLRNLAVIRDLANFPKALDRTLTNRKAHDIGIARHTFQGLKVIRVTGAHQAMLVRQLPQAIAQTVDA